MVEVIVKELPERPRPGEEVQLPNGEFVRVRHVGIPWLLHLGRFVMTLSAPPGMVI